MWRLGKLPGRLERRSRRTHDVTDSVWAQTLTPARQGSPSEPVEPVAQRFESPWSSNQRVRLIATAAFIYEVIEWPSYSEYHSHAMEVDHAMNRRTVVVGPEGPLEVLVYGMGPAVALLASLGRGANDFADLATRLAAAGFCALGLEPRGVGASCSPLQGVTMADLADDVAAVIRTLADRPATVVGHAFGNRVARMVATRHPDVVESVVLLACGGLVPPTAEVTAAMASVFDGSLDPVAHLDAVARAFFAPGNDPSPWEGGWHADTAVAQVRATAGTPVEDWWMAGSADVLVIQPEADVVAVPQNASRIVEMLGERASLVTIPDAGHALLPEQPLDIAREVLTWLESRRTHVP